MSMTHVFRNQATTKQKIQMISSLQITTKEEAVVFLRAIARINEQIANVLYRSTMSEIASKNRPTVNHTTPAPTPAYVPEPKEPTPVVIEEEETHTEGEAESRVEQLKKAVAKASKK